jgi:hypothetical protein
MSHAVVEPIVVYNYNDPTDPRAASETALHVSASSMNQVNLPSVDWHTEDGAMEFVSTPHTDIPTTPTLTDYFHFEITPHSGYQIEFTSLSLQAATGNGTGSNANSDTELTLQLYRVDNSTTTFLGFGTPPSQTVNQGNPFTAFTFDLPFLSPVTETTQFRLYVSDAGNQTESRTFRFDDVVVNGEISEATGDIQTAPIPEPTTALFGLALCGVIGCSRRRNKSRVSVIERSAV